MGVAYLLDLLNKRANLLSVYLELNGINDPAVAIRHQVDKTKKTVADFTNVIQTMCKGFTGGFEWF